MSPTIRNHKHWKYLYAKRRRRALGINARQMSYSQVFSLVGSVVAGLLLEMNKDILALFVGAFVILPGVFDLGGSLGAMLSAKIYHRLEELPDRPFALFARNIIYTFTVALVAGMIVAVIGASVATVFFGGSFWDVFILAEASVALSVTIGLPIVGLLSILFYRLKINPDDVVGPIESSLFDILTVMSLIIVAEWML